MFSLTSGLHFTDREVINIMQDDIKLLTVFIFMVN